MKIDKSVLIKIPDKIQAIRAELVRQLCQGCCSVYCCYEGIGIRTGGDRVVVACEEIAERLFADIYEERGGLSSGIEINLMTSVGLKR